MGFLKRLFGGKEKKPEYDEETLNKWYEDKAAKMEQILGKQHDMVMHAIIPYAIGGGLDLYYYPNDIEGVGIATMELCETPGEGSSNDQYELYEIVMFTRHALDMDKAKDDNTPFGKAHHTINAVLNCVAPYSAQAKLNHNDTCEFPAEMDTVGGKCLIFQAYKGGEERQPFGMMAVIEIFRDEMNYARENGTATLVEKLKAAGHFPYSDLDRDPVV